MRYPHQPPPPLQRPDRRNRREEYSMTHHAPNSFSRLTCARPPPPRWYCACLPYGCLSMYQDDAAFRRVISLRLQSRFLRWATPATMRGVGEVAVVEGVSFAEAVRLSVSRGQVEGGDASTFIYGLRRYHFLLHFSVSERECFCFVSIIRVFRGGRTIVCQPRASRGRGCFDIHLRSLKVPLSSSFFGVGARRFFVCFDY